MPPRAGLAVLLSVMVALPVTLSGPVAAQQGVTVTIGDDWFCASSFEDGVCTTQVDVGEAIIWDFGGADNRHTTTETGSLWDSGIMEGGTFRFTFNLPGRYQYLCLVHPDAMRGEVVVRAVEEEPPAQPSEEPPPPPPPSNTRPPPPTDTPVLAAPATEKATVAIPTSGPGLTTVTPEPMEMPEADDEGDGGGAGAVAASIVVLVVLGGAVVGGSGWAWRRRIRRS